MQNKILLIVEQNLILTVKNDSSRVVKLSKVGQGQKIN